MAFLSEQQRDQLVTLFIVMFDAAPGRSVLNALTDAYALGSSLNDIAQSLASKPAFEQFYPPGLSSEQIAAQITSALLPNSTAASAEAWANNWVVNSLGDGVSLGEILAQAAHALSVTTNANYASAKAQLANKVAVATYYSVDLGASSASVAEMQRVLRDVTDDAVTVAAAKRALGGGTEPRDGTTPVKDTTESLSFNVANGNLTFKTSAAHVTAEFKAVHGSGATKNSITEYASVNLDSNAITLNIRLVPVLDDGGTPRNSADDVLDKLSLSINTRLAQFSNLTALTLTGNGKVDLINGASSQLTTINASGLSSFSLVGTPDYGLKVISENPLAETLTLGAGRDTLSLLASTVEAPDVVVGLNLVAADGWAGSPSATLSDAITVGMKGFAKTVITTSGLNFALIEAARLTVGDHLVFHHDGDTYVYADTGASKNVLDDDDLLVKLVGTLDLDLLVASLNS